MDRYEKMTDEQLIQKLRDGDNRIVDYIMEKYNYSAVVEKTEAVYRKAVQHEYGSGNERKGR